VSLSFSLSLTHTHCCTGKSLLIIGKEGLLLVGIQNPANEGLLLHFLEIQVSQDVLQCVAGCAAVCVAECAAVCCRVLWCGGLRCVAECYSMLQCVATCCSVLQSVL